MAIKDHLSDIDFRTKEERQKHMIPDFIDWYKELLARQELAYSETTQAQLTMLGSVLWYLLPTKEYKKLTTVKIKK